MKKIYMKPLSEVVETELMTVLCASNPNAGFSTNEFEGDDDSWDVTENS